MNEEIFDIAKQLAKQDLGESAVALAKMHQNKKIIDWIDKR
jgi:hypothetical protein